MNLSKKLVPDSYFDLVYLRFSPIGSRSGHPLADILIKSSAIPQQSNASAMGLFYRTNVVNVAKSFRISTPLVIAIKLFYAILLGIYLYGFSKLFVFVATKTNPDFIEAHLHYVLIGAILFGIGLFLVPFLVLPVVYVRLLMFLRIIKCIPEDKNIELSDMLSEEQISKLNELVRENDSSKSDK